MTGTENTKAYIKEKVYEQYVEDSILRFRRLAAFIAVGETCIALLDYQNHFFQSHTLNHLNLLAEFLLIFSSIAMYYICTYKIPKKEFSDKKKVACIISYRVVIMLAVLMFIFTDIYVRGKVLGTYMVFLFVLLVTPAYKARINWMQFTGVGIFAVINYMIFVAHESNTLFGTFAIFLSFAISAEFLRRYFIKQLENYFLAEHNNQMYQRLSIQSIGALAGAVEAKDSYTNGHSQRVADYSRRIAEEAGYEEGLSKEVYFIALMHDIGKIGVPDSVINKTDRLTDEEFAMIKEHPIIGYEILKEITELPGISEGARWHHERYDGRGYPDGLKGEDIPEIARIIAVADAYDAMTSNRSYRKAMPQEAVRRQIAENKGSQFDPKFAEIMLKLIDEDQDYHMRQMD